MYCAYCGLLLNADAKFCTNCGAKVIVSSQSDDAPGMLNKSAVETTNVNNDSNNNIENNTNNNAEYTDNTESTTEYIFESQAIGNEREFGPLKVNGAYSKHTEVRIEDDYLNYKKDRVLGSIEEQIKIEDITTIESGMYFILWMVIFLAIVMISAAFTPYMVGIAILYRIIFAGILAYALIAKMKNERVILLYNTGKGKLVFDSKDADLVDKFIAEMKAHPKFKGEIKRHNYIIQNIMLLVIIVCTLIMIVYPDPLSVFKKFEGTYQEWEEAHYPDSYRTIIAADVTLGIGDTENDCILCLTGDNLDESIWIMDRNGLDVGEWEWLHDADPILGYNYALFEVTLTLLENEKIEGKAFGVTNPVALTYDEAVNKFGNYNDTYTETDNNQYADQSVTYGNTDTVQETPSGLIGTYTHEDYLESKKVTEEEEEIFAPNYILGSWYGTISGDAEAYAYVSEYGEYYKIIMIAQSGDYLVTFCGIAEYYDSDGEYTYDRGIIEVDLYDAETGNYNANNYYKELYGNFYFNDEELIWVDYSIDSNAILRGTASYYKCENTEEYGELEDIFIDPDSECYVLPDSSSVYYQKEQLEELSSEQLRIARNEIFARYGRRFKDEQLQSYFNNQSWYVPIYDPEEFDFNMENILNECEKANIEVIKEIEAERAMHE